MQCPECHAANEATAAVCTSCGLILLNIAPKRRSEDFAVQKRRAADRQAAACRFCGGEITSDAIRCRHCSEIVNEDYYRERAALIRSRINYASWVAYMFGLLALLVFRPVGAVSIAAGMLLSIIYYAIPVEPPATRKSEKRTLRQVLKQQLSFERVSVPMPAMRKLKLVFVGTPLVAAIVGYGANVILLQKPLDDILQDNVAFHGMSVSAHYEYWVIPGVVVYDLKGLSFRQRPIDVHTAFLEFAKKLREKKIDRVDLAYRGTTRFSINGDSFRRLGDEYARRNFEYVLYSFPRLFKAEDGAKLPSNEASDRDALLQFHRQWYGDDAMTKSAMLH